MDQARRMGGQGQAKETALGKDFSPEPPGSASLYCEMAYCIQKLC